MHKIMEALRSLCEIIVKFCLRRRRLIFMILISVSLLIYFRLHYQSMQQCVGDSCEPTDSSYLIKDFPSDLLQRPSDLKQLAIMHNKLQAVQNEAMLTSFDTTSTGVVFLVRVHEVSNELMLLVDSLSAVVNISTCFLIFSHDYVDKEINSYIAQIRFAPVLQIFFPFSIHLHPEEYPGRHPNDCLRDEKKPDAEKRKCNNAAHPDLYEHYREAEVTQIKHHWLWSVRFAFEKIRALQNFQGTLVYLEDTFYLHQDSVHVIRKAVTEVDIIDAQCSVLQLGTPLSVIDGLKLVDFSYTSPSSEVLYKTGWTPGQGVGLGIKKCLWQQLRECLKTYCTIDEYNWDWSLAHTANGCFQDHGIILLQPTRTRVYHTGACKNPSLSSPSSCSVDKIRTAMQVFYQKQEFFPSHLLVKNGPFLSVNIPGPFGGWSDPRDHALCQSMIKDVEEIDLKAIQNALNP